MEIKSPIGELPFEITDIRIGRDGLTVHGAMGAWPTDVALPWADVPALARHTLRAAAPYLATLSVVSIAAAAALGRRE
jgi:hypothetical protein